MHDYAQLCTHNYGHGRLWRLGTTIHDYTMRGTIMSALAPKMEKHFKTHAGLTAIYKAERRGSSAIPNGTPQNFAMTLVVPFSNFLPLLLRKYPSFL